MYVTTAEIRAAGVPIAISDPSIEAARLRAIQFLEKRTGRFFERRNGLTIDLDGNDSDTLFLEVPVIVLTSLFVNSMNAQDVPIALGVEQYEVYNGRGPTPKADDRNNPKIRMLAGLRNVFTGTTLGAPMFVNGSRNQRLFGDFGYVEADDSTPALINRAIVRMVILDLQEGYGGAGTSTLWAGMAGGGKAIGPRIRESTDGHSVSYGWSGKTVGSISGDAFVDEVLSRYRKPKRIAVPGSRSLRRG